MMIWPICQPFYLLFYLLCLSPVLALQRSSWRRVENHGRSQPGNVLEVGALRTVLSENPDSEWERPSKGKDGTFHT